MENSPAISPLKRIFETKYVNICFLFLQQDGPADILEMLERFDVDRRVEEDDPVRVLCCRAHNVALSIVA